MNESPLAVICLDLDGTSAERDALHAWFSEPVARQLNRAARRGAAWCTNSGRNAENQFGMIQACRVLETMPFAILAGERYIFDVHPAHSILQPRQPFNRLAREKAVQLAPRLRELLEPRSDDLEARFSIAEYLPSQEFTGWMLSEDADAAVFAKLIQDLLQGVPQAQVLRNGRWVVALHADFGKGRVLTATLQSWAVPLEQILAVGDQPNDLDMLDGRHAGVPGCPADADATVQATVRQAGGWVAEQPGAEGTAALIARFVDERLPRP